MSALSVTPFRGFPRQPYIVLGGQRSPGNATIHGLDLPRKWNEQPPFGMTGASLLYVGQGLSKFTATIDLWLPEHFIEWNLFATVLAAPKPGLGYALGIQHPIVNGPPHGITEVVVENVSDPVQSSTGLFTYTIAFKQYRKPLPAISRPIAAIPAVAPPQPTAQSAGEVEMLRLRAIAKAKGG